MTFKKRFVVLFLSVQVVLSADWWGICTPTEICALEGTTVELQCSFTYPPTQDGRETSVEKRVWFINGQNNHPEDLMLDPEYFGRLQSDCHGDRCNLTIADLRQSAVYKFRFTTNHPIKGSYTILPGVNVTVTDLRVQVFPGYSRKDMKCLSRCSAWPASSYIWYRNGEEIQNANSQEYSVEYYSKDSYSCAVRGHEHAASPPVCVYGSCHQVVYDKRRICALEGSSVDITCSYSSGGYIMSKFWFRPDRSHMWKNPSIPEDLMSDPQYAGRLQFLSVPYGRWTLKIKNVKASDSAQYRFKFTIYGLEWRSILPGSILTVTAVQVQVMAVRVEPSHVVAQLVCHTQCRPEHPMSFEWWQNGEKKFTAAAGPKLEVSLYPGEYVTCAGNSINSPRLYALSRPSVYLSDAAEILEGRPLTLNCSTNVSASPKHRWYKKRHSNDEVLGEDPELVFNSIKSSDSAEYWCTVENQLGKKTSETVFIDVQYAPKFCLVSVGTSCEVRKGASVNLTCSSDANPEAKYMWFKTNGDLKVSSESIMNLTNVQPSASGEYYCVASNSRGRCNATVWLQVEASPMMAAAFGGSVAVVVLVVLALAAFLVLRKKSPSNKCRESSESKAQSDGAPNCGNTSSKEEEDLVYSKVSFTKSPDGPIYSNVTPAPHRRLMHVEEDEVEYTTVKSADHVSGLKPQEGADVSELYSTVQKHHN
ncbi:carcinoembryonic antigen-related cell adhesion molecule 5-like isoform X3 [Dunckerocampus dactyliophorus]|uniref:carcinoembryonic antigen-related cell adhesion molecule 5-like isoform X3 n=1 Tax=Dunckerocampus dactyliophorus TaxID=161453 RepID=UPI002405B378|nr:carcinoembryonic antigen-related cell adhesion molecule 5-like isoform X3 [Dunckerocampus dactyliophorus]